MSILSKLFLAIIRLYQFTFSAVNASSCRFHPSCSIYTAESIKRFGALKGGWIGVKRICSCHPYNAGGYDPVPELEIKEEKERK